MTLVGRLELRRPDVIAAAPDLDLLLPVFLGGLLLVEALQRSVVALVQPPAALHRDPARPISARASSAVWIARTSTEVCTTEGASPASYQAPGLDRLPHPLLAERDVMPAGEQVLEVPGALPVAEQDQDAGLS